METQRDVSYAAFLKMLDRAANPRVKPRKPLVQVTDDDGKPVFVNHTRKTKKTGGIRKVVKTTKLMRYA